MIETKPVRSSQTTITELMIPSYANFGGKIHGGILLSLMDKVAYIRFASVYRSFSDVDDFNEVIRDLDTLATHAKRRITDT